jgi:hypothetical protein
VVSARRPVVPSTSSGNRRVRSQAAREQAKVLRSRQTHLEERWTLDRAADSAPRGKRNAVPNAARRARGARNHVRPSARHRRVERSARRGARESERRRNAREVGFRSQGKGTRRPADRSGSARRRTRDDRRGHCDCTTRASSRPAETNAAIRPLHARRRGEGAARLVGRASPDVTRWPPQGGLCGVA